MTTQQDYYERVREFAKEYDETPSPHVIDIMASVMMTRDNYMVGGNFVESVVNNNLDHTIIWADKECLENIKLIVSTKMNCYLEK